LYINIFSARASSSAVNCRGAWAITKIVEERKIERKKPKKRDVLI